MRSWTLTLSLISTILYTILLPLFLLFFGILITTLPQKTFIIALYLIPLSIPLTLSYVWYSYARGSYTKARLACFFPAALLLLTWALLSLV